jgi:glycosyltransferase involved in cell wall biosynthesis
MYSNMLFVPWARLAGNAGVIASRRWWNDIPRAAHRVLNRWSYHFAHRVLVNSPAIGSLVQHSEHISGDRVVVITNFVDHEMFNVPAESYLQRMRSELAITADAIVIGIVANLHEVKEHWVLLDAVARLTPRWPQLRVILIGDGTCRAELEEQARRLGIERHVVFAGPQPHHPSPNYLFDIAVLTSRAEGFPNAIVEAMAAGRPVVATAVGGVPDAVVEGETGFLVPPSQPEPLASALEALLRDPTRREAMGAAARKRAVKLYNAEAVIASLESLYDSIADPRRLVR